MQKERRDPRPRARTIEPIAGAQARGLVGVQLEDRPRDDAPPSSDPATTHFTPAARRSPSARRSSASSPAAWRHADARRRVGRRRPGSAGASLSMVSMPGPGRTTRRSWAGQDRVRAAGEKAAVECVATRTKRSGGYRRTRGDAGARQLRVEAPAVGAPHWRRLGVPNRAEARVGLAEKSSTGSNVGPGSANARRRPARGTIEERLTLSCPSPNSPASTRRRFA